MLDALPNNEATTKYMGQFPNEVSELLVLKATAVINGDIVTGKLVIEAGAVFNGTCRMGAAVKDIKLSENGGISRSLSAQQEAKSI